ncbi:maleylpyruvate isomerase family mycothiol-dependent enzyme [Actinosynnema sp. NPDC050436]|uniref:maleylpyruvate isomerase family mycothiol-dependent enzyme n=1 Tax=Actinosynnema sp. NPDC050436 TaxID=3155659 RepID=UPI0034094051
MPLTFDRYRAEIVAQARLLAQHVDGADPTTRVPSCPEWTVGQLLRHVGAGLRWVAEIVATRADGPLPDDALRHLDDYRDHAPGPLAEEVVAAAGALSEALGEAGETAAVWTVVPGRTPLFWARRFTHELVVHRADAALAVGARYELDPAVAADALDEWLELLSLPVMFEIRPELRELLGPDRTLHLHATDHPGAEWVVDLTGDAIAWRHAHEKSAVAARGPLRDLLLTVYRREQATALDVVGDRALLDFWLDRVSFG